MPLLITSFPNTSGIPHLYEGNSTIHFPSHREIVRRKKLQIIVNLTNGIWFSVVCTVIDNDTRHHSGQNVVDSRGATNFDHLFFDKSTRHAEPHSICFLPQYQR